MYGSYPLHEAARRNDLEAVKQLLVHNDINMRDSSNRTPLIIAAYYNRYEVAKFLINNGANLDNRDSSSSTALLYAAYMGFSDIAKLLIDGGANIDAVDFEGNTALHFAIEGGHIDIIELLLFAGADINRKDFNGKSPFDLARHHPKSEEINRLIGESLYNIKEPDF